MFRPVDSLEIRRHLDGVGIFAPGCEVPYKFFLLMGRQIIGDVYASAYAELCRLKTGR